MYVVGMDVDTQVSIYNVSYKIVQGYMLETSLYIVMIYAISCPNRLADLSLKGPYQDEVRGKISLSCQKNNQQETYTAHNFAFRQYPIWKFSRFYSITPHHPDSNRSKMSDLELGYYLAGLIEGDGHFSARLEIIFHENDIATAQWIKAKIGYGSIYKVKNKRAYKLSVGSRIGFTRLHQLLNGKFVGNHKVEQFNKNPYGLILSQGTNKVCLSNSWLAGFIDADGTIGIFIAPSKTHIMGKSCRLAIRIAQKDIQLLNLIKDAWQEAGVDENKIHVRFDGRVNRLVMTCRYTIIPAMIEYLDKYPFLTLKDLQYQYFRKAYLLMENKEHLTLKGIEKIAKFKTLMSNLYK